MGIPISGKMVLILKQGLGISCEVHIFCNNVCVSLYDYVGRFCVITSEWFHNRFLPIGKQLIIWGLLMHVYLIYIMQGYRKVISNWDKKLPSSGMARIKTQASQELTLIASFMGPIWDPSGANRAQMGPMLAPWTLLSGQSLVDWMWNHKLPQIDGLVQDCRNSS